MNRAARELRATKGVKVTNGKSVDQDYAIRGACKDVIAQTAYFNDIKDYERFGTLFTEDASMQRPNGTAIVGRNQIVEAYQSRPADRLTRHLISTTVFTRVDEGSVDAVSYVLLFSANQTDPIEAFGRKATSQVVGEFRDRLVLTREGWQIAQRESAFHIHMD